MERPKIENYSYRETNHLHTQKYVDDLNAYIDQEKAEKKALTKALEAIKNLTSGEELSLMKVLHESAHKTLK